MRDLFFRFGEVFSGRAARVSRAAVLLPLTRTGVHPDTTRGATLNVLYRWRKRVDELIAAGCVATGGRNFRTAARNCCPPFMTVAGGLRTNWCGATMVCPFCHARAVLEVWRRADSLFDEYYGPKGPYWLIEQRACLIGNLAAFESPALAELIRRTSATCPAVRKKYPFAIGGCIVARVFPHMTRVDEWHVQIRQLIHVPRDVVVERPPPGIRFQLHTKVTKKVLARAIARTWRYPVEFLDAPAARVAEVLDARREARARTTTLFGEWRG